MRKRYESRVCDPSCGFCNSNARKVSRGVKKALMASTAKRFISAMSSAEYNMSGHKTVSRRRVDNENWKSSIPALTATPRGDAHSSRSRSPRPSATVASHLVPVHDFLTGVEDVTPRPRGVLLVPHSGAKINVFDVDSLPQPQPSGRRCVSARSRSPLVPFEHDEKPDPRSTRRVYPETYHVQSGFDAIGRVEPQRRAPTPEPLPHRPYRPTRRPLDGPTRETVDLLGLGMMPPHRPAPTSRPTPAAAVAELDLPTPPWPAHKRQFSDRHPALDSIGHLTWISPSKARERRMLPPAADTLACAASNALPDHSSAHRSRSQSCDYNPITLKYRNGSDVPPPAAPRAPSPMGRARSNRCSNENILAWA